MLKAKKLKAGDTIALITLSAGLAGEVAIMPRWQLAKKRLEALGFQVQLTANAARSAAYISDHPEKRAADLMAALADPTVKAIICMIGGSDTIRLLPYIDFEVISNHPKLLIGYSDTTVNHFMFNHAGVASIYGPCAIVEFAENLQLHEYTLQHFLRLVTDPAMPLPLQASVEWTSEFLDWFEPDNNTIARKMRPEQHFYEFLQGSAVVCG